MRERTRSAACAKVSPRQAPFTTDPTSASVISVGWGDRASVCCATLPASVMTTISSNVDETGTICTRSTFALAGDGEATTAT